MTHQICVHTNDKHYFDMPVEKANISTKSWNESITHATIANTDALNDQIWDENEIIYWKRESGYEFIDDKIMDKMIKASLLESGLQTPLVIRQRKKQTADAQIIINWLGAKDERFFKDRASVLGFAYGPGRGIGGDCTMNSDHLWLLRKDKLTMLEAFEKGYIDESRFDRDHVNNTIKFYDPLHTLKHEIGGHALGMRHIQDVSQKFKAVMYPFYNGLRRFGNTDLAYLWDLYGNASVNHKIKEIILNKIFSFHS